MAQPLFGGAVELLEMDGMQAVPLGGVVIGATIVADMEHAIGADAEMAEDAVEQSVILADAVRAGDEHVIDYREHVIARRAGDMGAQLGFAQIHVADDDHGQATALRLGDQIDDGAEGKSVLCLQRQLGGGMSFRRRHVRLWPHRGVDVGKPDLQGAMPVVRHTPCQLLGPLPRLDAAAGQIERREDVVRAVRRAPDQRVETVEAQHLDAGRRPVEQPLDLPPARRQLHVRPLRKGASYRRRWLARR